MTQDNIYSSLGHIRTTIVFAANPEFMSALLQPKDPQILFFWVLPVRPWLLSQIPLLLGTSCTAQAPLNRSVLTQSSVLSKPPVTWLLPQWGQTNLRSITAWFTSLAVSLLMWMYTTIAIGIGTLNNVVHMAFPWTLYWLHFPKCKVGDNGNCPMVCGTESLYGCECKA